MNIWKELGISPTNNVREIKKAYASKSKLVHPEEHPEEFQRLHEAYRAAVEIANSNSNSSSSFSAPEPEQQTDETIVSDDKKQANAFDFSKTPKEHIVQDEQQQEQSFDFHKSHEENSADENDETEDEQPFDFRSAVHRESMRHNNEVMEKTEIVIKDMNTLYKKKLNDKESDWLNIFNTDVFCEIKDEPVFLEEFYKFLQSHKLSDGLVSAVYHFYNVKHMTVDYHEQGRIEDIYNVIIKERMRIYHNFQNVKNLCWTFLFLIAGVALFMWASDLWVWSLIAMIPAFVIILKLDKINKRKKDFDE